MLELANWFMNVSHTTVVSYVTMPCSCNVGNYRSTGIWDFWHFRHKFPFENILKRKLKFYRRSVNFDSIVFLFIFDVWYEHRKRFESAIFCGRLMPRLQILFNFCSDKEDRMMGSCTFLLTLHCFHSPSERTEHYRALSCSRGEVDYYCYCYCIPIFAAQTHSRAIKIEMKSYNMQ